MRAVQKPLNACKQGVRLPLLDQQFSLYAALVIEWFDRAQLLPYQLTMPTQGVGPTRQFGNWPVKVLPTVPLLYVFAEISISSAISRQVHNSLYTTPSYLPACWHESQPTAHCILATLAYMHTCLLLYGIT